MYNKPVKSEYLIDKFLTKFEQGPDLETLRKELKLYANQLHTSMTEILKSETEAIVKLAEHLTNSNAAVFKLSYPIYQLHEEIKTLYSIIKNAEDSLENHLEKRQIINKMCDTLNLQMTMKTTLVYVNDILNQYLAGDTDDLAMLERAVNEFSFQNSYLKELCAGHVKLDETTIEMENTFKELVDKVFIKSLRQNMQRSIVCCLRIYVSLNQQNKAEQIYSEKIVEPALIKIFTIKNLGHHNHKLDRVYAEALHFLNTDIKNLVDLINSNAGLKGFNFIINSYWKVTDNLLQRNLSCMTAPGNPELFQKRFQDTWKFLLEIVNQINPDLIYEKTFQDHIKRFNLPVYFEIRFQQISASFETDLFEHGNIQTVDVGSDGAFLKLNISRAFWRSVNHCFHPEVFIAHLADQFVKLSLLLLSRFLHFIDDILKNESNPPREVFIVNIMVDIETLKSSLGLQKINHIDKSIYKILPENLWNHIEVILKENENLLNNSSDKLKNYLINYNVQNSINLLQQISSIPRLYRRTNKSAPTEASNYVIDVVNSLEMFHKTNEQILKGSIPSIMDVCIHKIGEQYLLVVEEVLHSVYKTEESLRRLKSRNTTAVDESPGKTCDLTSDEAKIREQIKLDVKYFVTRMRPFVSEKGCATLETLVKESGCSM